MLKVLRQIAQEVNTANNLEEALAIIVRRIREAMAIDACSIFVVDQADGDYVLMATDGLNPAAVGQVRLKPHEGIVGLVGERQEPINLENAPEHPRYRYFPETGEERFRAFLGVPIIHYRQVLGVLVAQQRASRLFIEDEVALLITIAAQLAGSISDGRAGGGISKLAGKRIEPSNLLVQGIAAAPGVAVGTIVLPSPFASLESVPDRKPQNIDAEETVFRAAVAVVQKELQASSARLIEVLPPDAREIFDVYAMLLASSPLIAETLKRIRAGNWAPGALRDTVMEQAGIFERMEDSYLQARAEDIRGIGRRLLIHLQSAVSEPRDYPKRCVLVGEEVSPARIVDIPIGQLVGIVCTRGSVLSHTTILARALGIPAVMGLGALPIGNLEGYEMVVDGYQGRVIVQPSPGVRAEFQRLARREKRLAVELEALRDLPAETQDGVRVPLYANTGLLSDIAPSLESGAEGIGLHRTEFAFMVREAFPAEKEQYRIYRKLLESFAPRPVTMRTLDLGGDKNLPYFPIEEKNVFMGWRGIRITLDHPEIFLVQLRAMLRANTGLNNLQILLPMISDPREVDEARSLLERAYRNLLEEGQAVSMPRLGAMIEVPATLYQIEALARRVDFFSLGTNDLTQYLLAVDRNNPRVARLYDSLHPSVIRAIHDVIRQARQCDRPISVCGEIAADPMSVILLLGMGIDALSMAAPSIPRSKWVIRSFTRTRAHGILNEALGMEDPAEIHRLLSDALQQAGLSELLRVKS